MIRGVKICGLSTSETMQAALAAGADFIGLIFYQKSPRFISFEQAAALAAQARGVARIVAVVVDADDALLQAIMNSARPDYIQAHGSESPRRINEIKSRNAVRIIKAIKTKDADDVALAKAYRDVADIIMFDPKALGDALPGGNGLAFDWNLLKNQQGPFMLAGGLNPGNVEEAIRLTHAPMLDVSSGVETVAGKKDAALIRKFIEAVRRAS